MIWSNLSFYRPSTAHIGGDDEFKIDPERNRSDKTGLARVRGVRSALYKREYPMYRHFSIIARRVRKIRRANDHNL